MCLFRSVGNPAECLFKYLRPSVRTHGATQTADYIFIKFENGEYEELTNHFNFQLYREILTVTLHEELHQFLHVSAA
jgi:hypothetical protein